MGKKKAIVTINSITNNDKESEIEVVSIGTFEKINNEYIVSYDETELSGMAGSKTTIIINSDTFSLVREGTIETRMEFKDKKENMALYKTPYGLIDMKTFTKKLKINMSDKGGTIEAIYTLVMEESQKYDTKLLMTIAVESK